MKRLQKEQYFSADAQPEIFQGKGVGKLWN